MSRRKKKVLRGAGGIFFIQTFFDFARRWKDKSELERIGIRFRPSMAIEAVDGDMVHALILAGTRPELLSGEESLPDGHGFLDRMRTRFFQSYLKAPEFTGAVIPVLRRKASKMRVFFQTCYEFELEGKKLTLNTATDGEIARGIKQRFGVQVTTATVRKERQTLTAKMEEIFGKPTGYAREEILSYLGIDGKGKKTAK
jgi:hypothetical protein